MHRVTGLDALFLYMETPTTPMHVAGLAVCRPEDPDADVYEAVRAQIAARIYEFPAFQRVLIPAPLGLDHPVWETAETLDLDHHIRRAALPRPGGRAELMALVEELHTHLLDRKRPLWQFTVIEGLEGGRFALYMKSHHAILDGLAGAMAVEQLADRAPVLHPPVPHRPIRLSSKRPGWFERLGLAVGNLVQQQVNLAASSPAFLDAGRKLLLRARPSSGEGGSHAVPRTILNGTIGPERAFGIASIGLADVHALAKGLGCTVNDVILAATGGALRRWLEAKKALPPQPLVAMVPVSLREKGEVDVANHLTFCFPHLGTDVADPVERLRAIVATMGRLKRTVSDVKKAMPNDFSVIGAPWLLPMVWRTIEGAGLAVAIPPFMNLIVSNVPGPRRPLWFGGAEVEAFYPVSVAAHGVAMNVTLHSYNGRIDVGVIAARDVCAEAQAVADAIVSEFGALRAAAEAEAAKPLPAKRKTASPAARKRAPAPKRAATKASGQERPARQAAAAQKKPSAKAAVTRPGSGAKAKAGRAAARKPGASRRG